MSDLVDPSEIETIVGHARHETCHLARADSASQTVYVLHSAQCKASGIDLRDCDFSRALNYGITRENWVGYEDRPVVVTIAGHRLFPLPLEDDRG